MSDELIKVPKIRFEEFNDEWEQCKLLGVTERIKGNDGRMNLPTLTISASKGWLDQRDRFSGNIAGNEQKNYTLLKRGQLSYNHGNSKLAKYGVVFALNTFEEALVPKVYHSFKTNKDSNSDFIEYLFATKLPDRELRKLVSSGARMDGLLNISYEDFSNIKIDIPKIDEQEKISKLLNQLSMLINLHEVEHTLLLKEKKGYLQKIFPKDSEKIPEIRFDGYLDNWKKCKLSDFLIDFSKKSSKENEYPVLSSTNGGMEVRKGRVSAGSNIGYKIIDSKDLVLFPQNLWLGNININNMGKGLVSPSYKIFKIRNISSDFLFPILHLPRMLDHYKKASTQGASVVRRNLDIDLFNQIPLSLPNKQEQDQIGSFFKQIEVKITLQKRKLDLLKEVKKTMLKMMFI